MDLDIYGCALAGRRIYLHLPFQKVYPVANVGQADAVIMDVCRPEAAAVVFYRDEEDVFILAALYEDDAGRGMADGVAQQLLYDAIDGGLF
jgi:hypothetical protein